MHYAPWTNQRDAPRPPKPAKPQTLPEREARAIMAQVFAGLAYLNRGTTGGPTYPAGLGDSGEGGGGQSLPRVIHYDLKP
jgi:hypothetical protein